MNTNEKNNQEHFLQLDNRKKLKITGVTDTDKFTESSVLLYTCMGEMIIRGKNLQITALSVESGDMIIEGEINSIIYGDSQVKGPLGFLGRLTK